MTTLDNMNCEYFKFQNTVGRRTKQEAPKGVYDKAERKIERGSQGEEADPAGACGEVRASFDLCRSSGGW